MSFFQDVFVSYSKVRKRNMKSLLLNEKVIIEILNFTIFWRIFIF